LVIIKKMVDLCIITIIIIIITISILRPDYKKRNFSTSFEIVSQKSRKCTIQIIYGITRVWKLAAAVC